MYLFFSFCILYVIVCCSFYCSISFLSFPVFYSFIIILYLPFLANKRVHYVSAAKKRYNSVTYSHINFKLGGNYRRWQRNVTHFLG